MPSITPEGDAAAESSLVLAPELYPPSGGFTSDQMRDIHQRLLAGESFNSIAKVLACSHQKVARVAARFGIESASVRRAATESARRAATEFHQIQQRSDVDTLAARVREQLERSYIDEFQAKALRDLAVSLGVAIDKRRLIDGESTNNQSVQVRVWGRRELPTPPNP